MKRTTRALAALVACTALGCAAEIGTYDDEDEYVPDETLLAVQTAPLALDNYATRTPTALTACFVMAPNNTPGAAERTNMQNAIRQWTQDSALTVTWENNPVGTVNVLGVVYATTCNYTIDAFGPVFGANQIRIYHDNWLNYPNSPVQLPAGGTVDIPGCTSDENIGTQKVDDDGNPVVDAAGLFEPSGGMWGAYPTTRVNMTACLYNAHFFDQPGIISNYLHEFGHTLGFRHEHDRSDATCDPGGPDDSAMLTVYDQGSVMHYAKNMAEHGCVAPGNFGTTGLSPYDFFAAQMMFPYTMHAGVWGALGIVSGSTLKLSSQWQDQGAYVNTADSSKSSMKNFRWTVDGTSRSTSPSLSLSGLSTGNHTLAFRFDDWQGRRFTGNYVIEVMSQTTRNTRVVASSAVSAALF